MVFYHNAVFHISFHCTNNFKFKTKKWLSTPCNTFMYTVSNSCISHDIRLKQLVVLSVTKALHFWKYTKHALIHLIFFYSALQFRKANCVHILPKILMKYPAHSLEVWSKDWFRPILFNFKTQWNYNIA